MMRSTILCLCALAVPLAQGSCLGGHLHLKRQQPVDVATYGYIGADGPYLWGELPDSSTCEVGDFQSPVDLGIHETQHIFKIHSEMML